ncbi:MAG: L-aspartate oxidase [Acidimicrobiales bacterium]
MSINSEVAIRRVGCIVVGSGIAGLSAALAHGDCVVISKTATGDGSSRWAQGGIAAAVGDDDHPGRHAADTQEVSGGLGRAEIAELVTMAAPDRIAWLISLGAEFDTADDGTLTLGREAGHDRRRIVHANGDATGAEVMRTLVAATVARNDIERLDDTLVLDLLRDGERIVGVLTVDADRRLVAIVAPSVVLATGGIGRLYLHTTNPGEVTGDGMAMAARAGAAIGDPEFVQFHPTALHTALDPMPLLTEALRGEGAILVDAHGHRYMRDVHPDAELAPRDVVARENWQQRQRGPIYLDARSIGPDFPERFPTVWAIARRAGLDPRVDLLPVSPAEHYHMGGIATDDDGRSSLPGLFACGEAASTGLHGANRLASNSLLEGLVFGARVAEQMRLDATDWIAPTRVSVPDTALRVDLDHRGDADIEALRRTMWDDVGVVRDATGMTRAARIIAELEPRLATHPIGRNLVESARLLTDAALARTESRGSHHRRDFPGADDRGVHTTVHPDPAPSTTIIVDREPSRAGA